MENIKYYSAMSAVPDNAKKQIAGGKLKGMTDINPMWRIQKMTEVFGPAGIGWFYTIDKQWTETGAAGEVLCFCNINLFVKVDGEWSAAIPGTGGSKLVALEKGNLASSDEGYKMALTDAISVACKALGMGADVYWAAGRTKYSAAPAEPVAKAEEPPIPDTYCERCQELIKPVKGKNGKIVSVVDIVRIGQKNHNGDILCAACQSALAKGK